MQSFQKILNNVQFMSFVSLVIALVTLMAFNYYLASLQGVF